MKLVVIFILEINLGNASLLIWLFYLNVLNKCVVNVVTKKCGGHEINSKLECHLRLGHAEEQKIHKLVKDGLIGTWDWIPIQHENLVYLAK